MKANFMYHAARVIRYAGVIAVLAVAAGGALRAQFQTVFGGLGHEAAKGGIIQVADGNFVAVGYTTSFVADQDVYVVKTNGCGFIVWARMYDLGGYDEGRKIRQAPDGSLIIVGSTQNARNCCTRDDAFILSLTADGDVQWAKTYGGMDDDVAVDLLIPASKDVANITITVAGRSNSFGEGDYDGWLFQTDGSGNLLWGKVYGEWSGDEFNALDIDCENHIVAAGLTRSFSRAGDEDILVVWASPIDGQLIRSNVYGGPGDDAARSILCNRDVFYVAGYTRSIGQGTEGYVMKGACGTGAVLTDRTYGSTYTTGVNDDQFTEVKMLPTGNIILTGFLEDTPGSIGSYDMWLTELNNTLGRVFSRVYGGLNPEQGWSVAVVNPGSFNYGIIQAGSAYSFGFGRVDFYEVLSTSAGDAFCHQSDVKLRTDTLRLIANPVTLADARVRTQCPVRVGIGRNDQYRTLCTPCDRDDQQLQDDPDLGGMAPLQRDTETLVNDVAVRTSIRGAANMSADIPAR